MSLKLVLQTIPLILLILLVVAIVITANAPKPDTVARVDEYKSELAKSGPDLLRDGNAETKTAIQNFSTFLQKIDDKAFLEENTAKVYAENAYLNDTIVTHHGPDEIKKYFLMTADTMENYEVNIDDTASSGAEHYVRWTMVFSAPKLNGGKPVHSVGMSHIRLNPEGKVVMHQDYWDSGTSIYGQIPILGGTIEFIRRRFE